MARVADVLDALERLAPARYAFSFDKVGLQVGDPKTDVATAFVALDWSRELLAAARAARAELLITHHPLVWEPLTSLTPSTRAGAFALALAQSGIAHIACHTNWDCAPGGVNDALAAALELQDVVPFGDSARHEEAKLIVFCPAEAVDAVAEALADAGAGIIGDYSHCTFRTAGQGTFLGNASTNPAVGEKGRLEQVDEIRLETRIALPRIADAVEAIRRVHPYEEPAFDLLRLHADALQPIGRIGRLPNPVAVGELARHVDSRLATRCLAWGSAGSIERIAVVGGAADGEWRAAQRAGAQAYVTGEIKQHVALEAAEAGMVMIAAGHYATEQPGMAELRHALAEHVPEVEWRLFEPEPGAAGRPLA